MPNFHLIFQTNQPLTVSDTLLYLITIMANQPTENQPTWSFVPDDEREFNGENEDWMYSSGNSARYDELLGGKVIHDSPEGTLYNPKMFDVFIRQHCVIIVPKNKSRQRRIIRNESEDDLRTGGELPHVTQYRPVRVNDPYIRLPACICWKCRILKKFRLNQWRKLKYNVPLFVEEPKLETIDEEEFVVV